MGLCRLLCCLPLLVADLSTPDPRYGLDGLYTVLGLLLGINAYNERSALMQVLQQRQQQPPGDDAGSQ